MSEPKTDKPDEKPAETPKKRRSRKTSNYLVLRKRTAKVIGPDEPGYEEPTELGGDGLEHHDAVYEQVAANGTVAGAVKQIASNKIEGDLVIVCVRKRFTTSLSQSLVFKNKV